MTKLTETQTDILRAAAERDDRNVLPLPGSLRGGVAAKVINALLTCGLIVETTIDSQAKADAALNRIWRNDDEGQAVLLHLAAAGRDAVGGEPHSASERPAHGDEEAAAGGGTGPEAGAASKSPTMRPGTKQARLIEMLRTEDGATIDEIVAATGWQAHTVRGAFAGALKERLGLQVTSEKVDGRGRLYGLPPV